jgi:RHS repeat-associated protein
MPRHDASPRYDSTGRLSAVDTATQSTGLDYAGSTLISERSWPSYSVLRRYVHGPGTDEPLVWYEGAGTTDRRWLHTDERGSVIAVSNSVGTAIAINKYDEYGIPLSTNVGRFGFTGQTFVPEIGLWYYKARMYSPTLGRFMQTDPIGYKDGINWYDYVDGDPVNRSDPTGLSCSPFTRGQYTCDKDEKAAWRDGVVVNLDSDRYKRVRADEDRIRENRKKGDEQRRRRKAGGDSAGLVSGIKGAQVKGGQLAGFSGKSLAPIKALGGVAAAISAQQSFSHLKAEGHSNGGAASGASAGAAAGSLGAGGFFAVGEVLFPAGGGVVGLIIFAGGDYYYGGTDKVAGAVANTVDR